jgi:osmoprotectant transport system permease protein
VLDRLGQHLWIAGVALAVAIAVGLGLSMALSRFRRGGLVVTILGNAARSIPIVGVLVILALGPLGVGNQAAIVALIIFAIPPVLTNSHTGIQSVDPDAISAAVGLGMTNGQLTRRVRLPLAIPLIATGIRLAAVQVWATATIAAIVGSGGLGQLVTTGYATNNYGEVYGGSLVIVLTALILDFSLARAQRAVRTRFGDVSGAARA